MEENRTKDKGVIAHAGTRLNNLRHRIQGRTQEPLPDFEKKTLAMALLVAFLDKESDEYKHAISGFMFSSIYEDRIAHLLSQALRKVTQYMPVTRHHPIIHILLALENGHYNMLGESDYNFVAFVQEWMEEVDRE